MPMERKNDGRLHVSTRRVRWRYDQRFTLYAFDRPFHHLALRAPRCACTRRHQQRPRSQRDAPDSLPSPLVVSIHATRYFQYFELTERAYFPTVDECPATSFHIPPCFTNVSV